jgi:hypothetical protein
VFSAHWPVKPFAQLCRLSLAAFFCAKSKTQRKLAF